ncbi:hypothetical protein EW146_g4473 [Bondarzewia mesenterica]|uniref:Uncharacterized protein n=1 Tax=Bondarzewia mesenterica TaxID=1095465 RepID=A0A4S4LUY3_9AGAM|nr:hypothetical protein EW146_g4473 [Bondarzewia mesenterica]
MLRWGLSTVRRLGGHDASALRVLRVSDTARHNTNRVDHVSDAVPPVTYERVAKDGAPAQQPTRSSRQPVVSAELDVGALAGPQVDTPPDDVRPPSDGARDREAPSSSSNRLRRPFAFDVLHAFLSPHNLTSPAPTVHTANTLRALYLSLPLDRIAKLSSRRLTDLISLFGTLSACDGPRSFSPSAHTNAFVVHMDQRSFRPWWNFILHLVRDKNKAGKKLLDLDYYWLLRARLACVDGIEVDAGEGSKLSKARHFYLRTDLQHTDLDVHAPYVRTLLSLQRPSATTEAVGWLCTFLSRDADLPPGLMTIFWDIIMGDKIAVPEPSKDKLLAAIWRRMSVIAQGKSDGLSEEVSDDNTASFSGGVTEDSALCVSAADLTRQVLTAIFPRNYPVGMPTPAQYRIHAWAVQEAQDLLTPLFTTSIRWRNLTLLALANHHTHMLSQAGSAFSSGGWDEKALIAADFRIVAVLAILERTGNTRTFSPDIQSFVRGVWRMWSEAVDDDRSVHPAIIRPLIASFVRLAARARDDDLRRRCLHLCGTGFWTFDVGDDFAKRQVQLLAVDFIVAAVMCGQRAWGDVVSTLPHFIAIPQWQANLMKNVFVRLADLDATLAYELFRAWSGRLDVPKEVSIPICVGLVTEGRMDLAAPLLAESKYRFVGEEGERVLGALLLSLAKAGNRYIDLELADMVSKALHELYQSKAPPAHFRGRISYALLALITSGCSSVALSTFQSIRSARPSYFPPSHIDNILRTLVTHRQFRKAFRLVENVEGTYPRHARRWRCRLLVRLAQEGSSRLAKRVSSGLMERSFGVALGRVMKLGGPSGSRKLQLVGFRVLRWLRRPQREEGPADMRHALHLLAQSRGVDAGRQVYAHLKVPDDRRVLGNIILNCCAMRPRRRDAENAREVMKMLARLAGEHGFVPDRVTTNIVVKAMLRWRSGFDGAQVRMLFDHLVQCGYPGGSRYSRDGEVPFGTARAEGAGVLKVPVPVPLAVRDGEKLQFVRHVRPLYKMFIKAFFVRGDAVAARIVVGILKDVEGQEVARARERSMRRMKNGNLDNGPIE